MNEDLKILKAKRKLQADAQRHELIKMALNNPVVEIIGGGLIIETLYKSGFINSNQREFVGTAIVGAVIIQQLAPSIPALAQASTEIFKTVGPAIAPAVGAALALPGPP